MAEVPGDKVEVNAGKIGSGPSKSVVGDGAPARVRLLEVLPEGWPDAGGGSPPVADVLPDFACWQLMDRRLGRTMTGCEEVSIYLSFSAFPRKKSSGRMSTESSIVRPLAISMEITILKPQFSFFIRDRSCPSLRLSRNYVSFKPVSSDFSRRQFSSSRHVLLNKNKGLPLIDSHSRSSCIRAASTESTNYEQYIDSSGGGDRAFEVNGFGNSELLEQKSNAYRSRFLNIVKISSIINDKAESFFKSEIRRRLFVTAVLLVISRLGYFIPLPGFDRRLMPENYLGFISGSVDELGDFAPELKLSLFQLGIGPQIGASIIMQVLCHVIPSLVKLRKEGLDGHEKIKSYIWWISLGIAVVEALVISLYSLPYSIYAASHRVKHVMITSSLLVCGAMAMNWICEQISESGFGQGSSLIICVSILTGYTETLHKMLTQLSGSTLSWWPYVLAVFGVFTMVTMWAVVVTEGCRKIKLQYYGFKLASAAREDSPITEVEPYIPFNINPAGMQPVLTTSYLLAFPTIVASLSGSRFWEHLRDILNPDTHSGAAPWVYYSIYAFFVFLFNIFDIANMPKEISDYLNKMGARIPNIKPGQSTIEYLTKIQASTRFWGGILLSVLATTSSILDHNLRRINEGFSIGFTSILIIVGSIIELRRSYQAYNVMPSLSKALRRMDYNQASTC
ncbi:protein translocase secy subunit [Striga asiatica]|uniref:Protein translocase secy subunit n=1 Tax=Striga asiatica TaxID=4170 RepID=A0A5A7RCB4_STRAF|nr:protein translocase secy subunit [Striga asiatica]